MDKKHFPGQGTGEKVNLLQRRHALSFLPYALFTLAMIIIPLIILIILINTGFLVFSDPALDYKILIVVSSAYLLFCLGFTLVAWMNYYLDIYIVTDRRIIDVNQEGLLARDLAAIDLVDVEDVKASVQGLLSTFFNYGNVYVQTAADVQNVEFRHVPDPYTLARQIMDWHEEAVRLETKEKNIIKAQAKSEVKNADNNKKLGPAFPKPKRELESESESEIKPKDLPQLPKQPKKLKEFIQQPEKINQDNLKQGGKIDLNK